MDGWLGQFWDKHERLQTKAVQPTYIINATLISTFARSDGGTQAEYDGHPLYYYAGDLAPGDANGQGLDMFGAKWFALTPAGKPITSVQGPFGGY